MIQDWERGAAMAGAANVVTAIDRSRVNLLNALCMDWLNRLIGLVISGWKHQVVGSRMRAGGGNSDQWIRRFLSTCPCREDGRR
jgi:hypothetical protein